MMLHHHHRELRGVVLLCVTLMYMGIFSVHIVMGNADLSLIRQPQNNASPVLILRLKDGWNTDDNIVLLNSLIKRHGNPALDALGDGQSALFHHMLRVRLDQSEATEAMRQDLLRLPFVASVSEDTIYMLQYIPNDPLFARQWNFEKINIPQAWDSDTSEPLYGGDPSITVAVIDSGVAYETFGNFVQAPDLSGTSFVEGYDFVDTDTHANDEIGHGTHVAGTIAQTTSNAVGSAGIAFKTTIMPIRVCGVSCYTSTVAEGIAYAISHGADIINMSLGGSGDDPLLHAAITEAISAGVIVVSVTGNGGNDGVGDVQLEYPGAYQEVIAVGATQYDDHRAQYSNYGLNLDFSAPGGTSSLDQNSDGFPDGIIQQTFANACSGGNVNVSVFEDSFCQGTSMAAPHVSGVMALLLSIGFAPADIGKILQQSAKDLGDAGYDVEYGWGLIDADAATKTLLSGSLTVTPKEPVASNKMLTLGVTSFGGRGAVEMSFSNDGQQWSDWESFSASRQWDVSDVSTGGNGQEGDKIIYARLRDSASRLSSVFATSTLPDTAPPVMTIKGLNPASIIVGSTYSDAGADATDDVDGNITGNIAVSGSVNTAKAGKYTVTYTVFDAEGNTTEAIRTVYVLEPVVVAGLKEGSPVVRTFSKNGKRISQFLAYDASMEAGINVVTGDFDGDGIDEIAVSPRAGGAGPVKIFGQKGKSKKWDFKPYGTNFSGGISLAARDLENDGTVELMTAPMEGKGAVQIFGFQANKMQKITPSFYPYGKNFTGGISITAANIDGKGKAEIITAPLGGGGPQLRIYGIQGKIYTPIMPGVFAYDKKFRNGVVLTSGDIDGDGIDEVITGTNQDASTHTRIFKLNGKNIFAPIDSGFFAYKKSLKIGVSLATLDLGGSSGDTIVLGMGQNGSMVRLINEQNKSILPDFRAFSSEIQSGVTVSGGYRW